MLLPVCFDELNSKGKTPLLTLKNVKVSKMSWTAIEQLRLLTKRQLSEDDGATLVECIHSSKDRYYCQETVKI